MNILKVFIVLLILFSSNICFSENYNRTKHFGNSWNDADFDGQNTRQEVLIRDSLIPVGFDKRGKVNYGLWECPYTGTFTTDPTKFDIDHFVPLKEAYISGADEWSKTTRVQYSNNLQNNKHLLATTAGSNRQKGAKDIAGWLPLLNKKSYILTWINIKEEWNLCFDKQEVTVIKENLGYGVSNICKP
jgi:hypothetical protein